jgi:hypothetical protein
VEIQNGVMGRAWRDSSGHFYNALLAQAIDREACNAIADASLAENSYAITELLPGDVARDPVPSSQQQDDRFFLLERKEGGLKPAGYLVRIQGSHQSQAVMLPDDPGEQRCASATGYEPPPSTAGKAEFCAIQDLTKVRVEPAARRRDFGLWTWLEAQNGSPDHPCLCLAEETCADSPA